MKRETELDDLPFEILSMILCEAARVGVDRLLKGVALRLYSGRERMDVSGTGARYFKRQKTNTMIYLHRQ